MHHLVITVKGDLDAAKDAMGARRLRTSGPWGAQLVGVTAASTTWRIRPSRGAHAAVVSWLAEPAVCCQRTGFPPGTLLHRS